MADITQKYAPPSFDSYATQMKGIEKQVEADRYKQMELDNQNLNKVMMNESGKIGNVLGGRQTAVEIMAGVKPQDRPQIGGMQGGGGMAPGAGIRNKRADILGNYMKAKDKEFVLKRKTRLDDEKKLTELYKAFEYESRGTSHLKKMRIDSMKIDRAMRAIDDFLSGKKRIPTQADMTDLSAAATALITGGMPPEKLIDATTLKTIRGKYGSIKQFFSGIPQEYYTRNFLLQLRAQFKSFDETVKHDLSKHAVSVWNRGKPLFGRNKDWEQDIMRNYGHRLGFIDPETGLATPRNLNAPYKSFDNDNHTPDLIEHNVLFNTAMEKGNVDAGDIEYAKIIKNIKDIKDRERKEQGPGILETAAEEYGGSIPSGSTSGLIGDKLSSAGQRMMGGARNFFDGIVDAVQPSSAISAEPQQAPMGQSVPQPINNQPIPQINDADEMEKRLRGL